MNRRINRDAAYGKLKLVSLSDKSDQSDLTARVAEEPPIPKRALDKVITLTGAREHNRRRQNR